jgi:hypothetical protein
MLYLDVYVVAAGLIATIILIVDLRALRAALERERTERIAENERRHLVELAQARLAYARHAELVGILLANIVPDRPPVDVAQPEESEDPPQTSREPAVARSQRPPAPIFDPKDSAASTGERDEEIAPAAVR